MGTYHGEAPICAGGWELHVACILVTPWDVVVVHPRLAMAQHQQRVGNACCIMSDTIACDMTEEGPVKGFALDHRPCLAYS